MLPARPRRAKLLPRGVALLPLTLGSLLSGCYSYRATPPGDLGAGAEVRLLISADGARDLTDAAGLRLRTIEGRVQSTTADGGLVVLPTDITTVDGDALPWRRGPLTVSAQALEGTQRRSVSRRKSIVFAAAIAGAFTSVVVYAFRSISGGSGSSVSPGGGTPE